MEATVKELHADVAGMARVVLTVERLSTTLEGISALIGAHVAAEGHQYTVIQVERLKVLLERLEREVGQIEKRQG